MAERSLYDSGGHGMIRYLMPGILPRYTSMDFLDDANCIHMETSMVYSTDLVLCHELSVEDDPENSDLYTVVYPYRNRQVYKGHVVTISMGLVKYFGLQFRYVYPLCDKKEWKKIIATSPFEWNRSGYPKDVDCVWKEQVAKGVRKDCDKPPFTTTKYVKNLTNLVII